MTAWSDDAGFDLHAFAYTMLQFVKFKGGYDSICDVNLEFHDGEFYPKFRWIFSREDFEATWHVHLQQFYLREELRIVPQPETEHFKYYLTEEDAEQYYEGLSVVAEETYDEYMAAMDTQIPWKVIFGVYPTQCDFDRSPDCVSDPFAQGEALGMDVFLTVAPHALNTTVERFHTLVRHEYAHVVQTGIYSTRG